MECRICLESDDPDTMLSPCQCRGTSAYVHQRCLERYFHFYPDGICRVCMGQIVYYSPDAPVSNYIAILMFMYYLVWNTDIGIFPKIYLIFGCMGLLRYYYLRKMLSNTIASITMLLMLFYLLPTPDFSMSILVLFGLVFYACIRSVPVHHVGIVLTLQLVGLYAGLLLYTAYTSLNTHGYSLSVAILFLSWMLWIKMRPEIHVE